MQFNQTITFRLQRPSICICPCSFARHDVGASICLVHILITNRHCKQTLPQLCYCAIAQLCPKTNQPNHWLLSKMLPKWILKTHQVSLLRPFQTALTLRPSTAEAPPIGKIHLFSKIAVTFEPLMRCWCPSGSWSVWHSLFYNWKSYL